VLTLYSRKYWNFHVTEETRYRKRNYIRCNFIPASRVRLALKDERVHRGEAVKPTGTTINNFERECRSFNGINVAPRTAAASNVPTLATCAARTHCVTRGSTMYHLRNVAQQFSKHFSHRSLISKVTQLKKPIF